MVYYIYGDFNSSSTQLPMIISSDSNRLDDLTSSYPLFLLTSSSPIEPQELSVFISSSTNVNTNGHPSHAIKPGSGVAGANLGEIFHTIGIGVTLAALILATIVGNVFVIIAILMEKNLRSVGNYLVLSLAIADLMVACLVMPLGAVYEVSGEWILGPQWCDIWTCADVLCCTASILHLLAIAIDRYWAVTNIDYIHNRNPNRIGALIICIWTIASIISVAPVLGWKDPDFEKRLLQEKKCLVSQDVAYQIVATFATFYGPLVFILLLYWRIYQVKFIQHSISKFIPTFALHLLWKIFLNQTEPNIGNSFFPPFCFYLLFAGYLHSWRKGCKIRGKILFSYFLPFFAFSSLNAWKVFQTKRVNKVELQNSFLFFFSTFISFFSHSLVLVSIKKLNEF
uniref:G-protein coupled receptors family 1 profile domain-containing protein n=1 Tax=Tetranychus urticae TaxID=32264 RepID=T1KLK4_TETUR